MYACKKEQLRQAVPPKRPRGGGACSVARAAELCIYTPIYIYIYIYKHIYFLILRWPIDRHSFLAAISFLIFREHYKFQDLPLPEIGFICCE